VLLKINPFCQEELLGDLRVEVRSGEGDTKEISSSGSSTTSPHIWRLISNAGKGIAWIGASIGGIVVMISTFGFFALYSNETMLGIQIGLRAPLEYIIAGGLFLTGTINILGRINPIKLNVLLSVFSLLLMVLSYAPLKGLKRYSYILRGIAVIGVISVQFLLSTYIASVIPSNNFLVSDIPNTEVNKLIVQTDFDRLEQYYGSLTFSILVTAFTSSYWCWKSFQLQQGKQRLLIDKFNTLLKIVALVLAIDGVYHVPQLYGILIKRNIYPEIIHYSMPEESDPFINSSARGVLFLLYQDDKTIVIYDRANFQIVYVRRDIINFIRVGGYKDLLSGRRLGKP
jgi:hypothetical protein